MLIGWIVNNEIKSIKNINDSECDDNLDQIIRGCCGNDHTAIVITNSCLKLYSNIGTKKLDRLREVDITESSKFINLITKKENTTSSFGSRVIESQFIIDIGEQYKTPSDLSIECLSIDISTIDKDKISLFKTKNNYLINAIYVRKTDHIELPKTDNWYSL